MFNINTTRLKDEDFNTYALRLYSNKKEYGINNNDIAKILNSISDTQKDESAWRKFYTAFRKGIEYTTNTSNACTRILSLSDFHFPFQLPKETFSDYKNVDILVINGDLLDFQGCSKFSKLYRVSPLEEMVDGRQYLIDLVDYINPKKVYVNVGNHEKRFGSYLAKKLENELIELHPDTALDYIITDGFYHYDKRKRTKVWYEPIKNVFDNIEIIFTGDWFCKIGKTIFAHPLAYSSGMLKTTEKAVNYFYRTNNDFDCIVLGHTHALGGYTQGHVHLYEQGCCSNTDKLDYMDGRLSNPQQKGFIQVCQDKDGNIISNKTKLIGIK